MNDSLSVNWPQKPPEAVRLRTRKFQNFPGGTCPQTPLVWTRYARCSATPISPPWQKILYKSLPCHAWSVKCDWSTVRGVLQ